MTISSSAKLHVPPDVLVQELQGEAVLLNVRNGQYFGLDDVGTRMWAVLTTTESFRSACETLLTEYKVEPGRLEQDLKDLVTKLVEHGLVEVGGG
jgi:hypothetical protein